VDFIYSTVFDWLVAQINKALRLDGAVDVDLAEYDGSTGQFIGILDIFGFETFEINSLEQLCINFCNERLQATFNEAVFNAVQEENAAEGIKLPEADLQDVDNAGVVKLIGGRPGGILHSLNEECIVPKGSDASLLGKLLETHKGNPLLKKSLKVKESFVVTHFVGEVTYLATGLLLKNKDPVSEDLMVLLQRSRSSFVQGVFAPASETKSLLAKKKDTRFQGVAAKFQKQLEELLRLIGHSHMNFIRCIKPNREKVKEKWDAALVTMQLRCSGVFEAVRVIGMGFPDRIPLFSMITQYARLVPDDDPDRLAYHRLRHLSAHEIGHSIGLAHNFAASMYEGRASVLDYPAPWVIADGDRLDFSQAYTTDVGAWDRYAIDWLYGDTPGQDPQARRLALAAEAQAKGYRFVGDGDTRPLGSLQPYGAMWDNGTDPVAEFANTLAVRRIALSRFGLANLPAGAPAADLRRVIVPIYLYHRYQTTAVGRQIGGVDYSYAVSGEGRERAEVVPADKQRAALEALMLALSPAELDLRDDLIDLLSSAQSGNSDRQTQIELFEGKTDAVFDPSSAAAAATEVVFETLLAPERLNRLVEQERRDPGQLGLVETLDRVAVAVGPGAALSPRQAELRRVARARYAALLAALIQGKDLSSTAQGAVRDSARRFGEQLKRCRGDRLETAQCAYLAEALTGPVEGLKTLSETLPVAQAVPPGAPI
jgi:hypothetical protein